VTEAIEAADGLRPSWLNERLRVGKEAAARDYAEIHVWAMYCHNPEHPLRRRRRK
jgi:hypothetical protein